MCRQREGSPILAVVGAADVQVHQAAHAPVARRFLPALAGLVARTLAVTEQTELHPGAVAAVR